MNLTLFPIQAGTKGAIPVKWGSWISTPENMAYAEKRWPGCNWGVNCSASNVVVIDDDGELAEWLDHHGVTLPPTFSVSTGRPGGLHRYYRWQHGGPIKIKSVNGHSGFKVDIKAEGGMALAAGSVHPSGRIYTKANDLPIADLPGDLVAILGQERAPEGDSVVWSAPEDWTWGITTTTYVGAMIHSWPGDPIRDGSHAPIFGKMIRLECAKRFSDITQADYEFGYGVLAKSRQAYLEAEGRDGEYTDQYIETRRAGAVKLVSEKTDEEAADEVKHEFETVHEPATFKKAGEGFDDDDDDVVCLADIKPEKVEWLWDGWLPKGKIVILDGMPDVGKSTMAIEIAARLSRGELVEEVSSFDNIRSGEAPQIGIPTLLLCAEDGLADTVVPRVLAAEGDINLFHVINHNTVIDPATGKKVPKPITLGDIDKLRKTIEKRGIKLCVVDVFMAHLPSASDSDKDQSMRQVLTPLKKLAEDTSCTFLLLRHLTKGAGDKAAAYGGGGSVGITGAARVGLIAGKHPENDDICVLAQSKNNLAQKPAALQYQLVDGGGAGRVKFLGPCDLSADDIVRNSKGGRPSEASDTAACLIGRELASGLPKSRAELLGIAKAVDISEATLDRTLKILSATETSLLEKFKGGGYRNGGVNFRFRP